MTVETNETPENTTAKRKFNVIRGVYALLNWLLYSALGSGIPYIIFLVFKSAFVDTKANGVVELGGFFFSVVLPEVLASIDKKADFKTTRVLLLIGFIVFIICYFHVYSQSFRGYKMLATEETIFNSITIRLGIICIIFVAILRFLQGGVSDDQANS